MTRIVFAIVVLLAACGREQDSRIKPVGQKPPATQPKAAGQTEPQDPQKPKAQKPNVPQEIAPTMVRSRPGADAPGEQDPDGLNLKLPHPYKSMAAEQPWFHGHVLLARDPRSGDVGGICNSSIPAAAGQMIRGRAGVGVVAVSGKFLGDWQDIVLERLEKGEAPKDIVADLTADEDRHRNHQLAVLAADGRTAGFSGYAVPDWSFFIEGEDYVLLFNTSDGDWVANQLKEAWPKTNEMPLPERLMATLGASHQKIGLGLDIVSASLQVYRERGGPGGRCDRFVDIRVDYLMNPIAQLRRIYKQSFQALTLPRLRLLHRGIKDNKSPAYEANRDWLRRMRRVVEPGVLPEDK